MTLYAFSAQNWDRPTDEVDQLMGLLKEFVHTHLAELLENGIRLTAIGHLDTLPRLTRETVLQGIRATRDAEGMTLCLALSYGAREEIVSAAQALAHEVASGTLKPEDIDAACLEAHLQTASLQHDPDLVIRTSGEKRLSNFLLWQAAYAEFHFTPVLWPDFTAEDLDAAIAAYRQRKRRFGRVLPSQVIPSPRRVG